MSVATEELPQTLEELAEKLRAMYWLGYDVGWHAGRNGEPFEPGPKGEGREPA